MQSDRTDWSQDCNVHTLAVSATEFGRSNQISSDYISRTSPMPWTTRMLVGQTSLRLTGKPYSLLYSL